MSGFISMFAICFVFLAIGVFDAWLQVNLGPEATVTSQIRRSAATTSAFPFLWGLAGGLLAGHLFL